MRAFHLVLTVLFILALLFSLFNFVVVMGKQPMPNDGAMAAGHVFGSILAAALIPGIIWIIRHFVGKELKK